MTISIAKYLLTAIFFGIICLSLPATALAWQETDKEAAKEERSKFLMRLNKGRKITANKTISMEFKPVDISPALITHMRIGYRSNLSDASWIDFSPTTEISLPGTDGEKTVYAQLKDKAGNLSEIVSSVITYDTKAPTATSITINQGAPITNSKTGKVKLDIKAEGAFKMKISNNPDFAGVDWERYTEERIWVLDTDQDGAKTVYALFADIVDNTSPTTKASIALDREAPTGSITIDDGARFSTDHEVRIKITSDASDVAEVRIVSKGESDIMPYPVGKSINRNWTLDSLDGKKAIAVFFRDKAGNISEKPAVADIILDTQRPEKPFLNINRGLKYTTDAEGTVDIKIGTRETPTGYTVFLSNDERFAAAEKFAYKTDIKDWKLSPGDGLKTIYVKYVDQAGNESEVTSDRITLDTQKPVAKTLLINEGAEWTHKPTVALTVKAEGADLMQVYNRPELKESTRWVAYTENIPNWILQGEEGVNTVHVRFRDAAGNYSEELVAEINLDTKPPVGRIIINEGQEVLTNSARMVKLNVVYNSVADEMMLSNDPEFTGAKWEPAVKEVNEWMLSEGDGEKVVFAKFRDKAGLVSPVAADKILLDTKPPVNTRIMVNNNAKFTAHHEGLVLVKVRAEGAKEMLVHERFAPDSTIDWEPYRPVIELHLHGDDGDKEVVARFRDEHGNESEPVSAHITLDRSAPTARLFVINNGAEWTNSKEKKVSLKLNADDAHQMKIAIDKQFETAKWEPFTREINDFVLPGEDGQKELWVIFKDEAGNLSDPINASIKLKREF